MYHDVLHFLDKRQAKHWTQEFFETQKSGAAERRARREKPKSITEGLTRSENLELVTEAKQLALGTEAPNHRVPVVQRCVSQLTITRLSSHGRLVVRQDGKLVLGAFELNY